MRKYGRRLGRCLYLSVMRGPPDFPCEESSAASDVYKGRVYYPRPNLSPPILSGLFLGNHKYCGVCRKSTPPRATRSIFWVIFWIIFLIIFLVNFDSPKIQISLGILTKNRSKNWPKKRPKIDSHHYWVICNNEKDPPAKFRLKITNNQKMSLWP